MGALQSGAFVTSLHASQTFQIYRLRQKAIRALYKSMQAFMEAQDNHH